MLSTQNSISNGNSTGVSLRTAAREGFFIQISREIRRRFPQILLIVTGGFRSLEGINRVLAEDACDAVGLGRPAIKFPGLPNTLFFDIGLNDADARFDVEAAPFPGWIATKIRSVGAGAETVSTHSCQNVNTSMGSYNLTTLDVLKEILLLAPSASLKDTAEYKSKLMSEVND